MRVNKNVAVKYLLKTAPAMNAWGGFLQEM